MKIFFVLLLCSQIIFAEHIRWRGDYEASLQAAKLQNKDIFLLILKKEDKKSLALFTDIFADVTISKLINKNFVPVIVFFENKDSYPLELFYTQNFPSIFLVSADDESYLKKPLMGIFDAVELKNLLL
jgi:hypothetical protein